MTPDAIRQVRDQCLNLAARRTANAMSRLQNAHFAPLGIEAPQFGILCALGARQYGSATELAAILGIERSTLTRNLGRLIAAGLVRSRPGVGRRLRHALTAEGRAMLARAMPLWRAAHEAVLAALPEGQDVAIRAALATLHGAAVALQPGSGGDVALQACGAVAASQLGSKSEVAPQPGSDAEMSLKPGSNT